MDIKIKDFQSKTILSSIQITTLLLLDNKNDIVTISLDSKLIIFELKFLTKKLVIDNLGDSSTLLDIVKLSENKIAITCWNYFIYILKLINNNTGYEIFQKLEGHLSYVNALIVIKFYEKEKFLASNSSDAIVIIWEKENNYYKLSKKLDAQHTQTEALIESVKYRELICGSHMELIINFYDLETFTLKSKLTNIFVNRCIRSINIINEDYLIVAGYDNIYIISLKNHEVIKNIQLLENGKTFEFNCVYLMKNNNILISQYIQNFNNNNKSYNIIQYLFDENKKELIEISRNDSMHKNYITTILELDNHEIITGGYDGLIKIWTHIIKH